MKDGCCWITPGKKHFKGDSKAVCVRQLRDLKCREFNSKQNEDNHLSLVSRKRNRACEAMLGE